MSGNVQSQSNVDHEFGKTEYVVSIEYCKRNNKYILKRTFCLSVTVCHLIPCANMLLRLSLYICDSLKEVSDDSHCDRLIQNTTCVKHTRIHLALTVYYSNFNK